MLGEARKIFATMPQRNFVSWSLMIAANAEAGDLEAARDLYERSPTPRDMIVSTAMLSGYARNGCLDRARSLFDEM
ncbi:hypothetical protein SELMODRAFT_19624, partial [Selaginella moellendorffii]